MTTPGVDWSPLIRELLTLDASGPQAAPEVRELPVEDSPIDDFFSCLGWESALRDVVEDAGDSVGDGPWMLSIDDDDDHSFSLKLRLEEQQIKLVRAFAGQDGFRSALSFSSPPRAILLDYEMPDVNGDYVLRRLRETPMTRDLPVVVLTGHKDAALRRRMLQLGADAFLTKPLRWQELWSVLQPYVEQPPLEQPQLESTSCSSCPSISAARCCQE